MADLAETFPVEVFNVIFDYATDSGRDSRTLANCCRVNSAWKTRLRPQLYTNWTFYGDKHTVKSLWKFLCTTIRHDDIAALVQTVDLRHMDFPSSAPQHNLIIPEEEIQLVQQAYRGAGMKLKEKTVKAYYKYGLKTQLTTLLFTRLPNISTMAAHFFCHDHTLEAIMRGQSNHLPGNPTVGAFQKLENLFLVKERDHETYLSFHNSRDPRYKLDLNICEPFFHLPQIKNLSFFDVDVADTWPSYALKPGTSTVQHLTLVNHKYANATAAKTQGVLEMPKALISLTFYQNYYHVTGPGPEAAIPISNDQLFTSLGVHRKSLEHLDLYRESIETTDQGFSKETPCSNTLRGFERLRTLCIQPERILGALEHDAPTPLNLKNTLPTSLESLTFYGTRGVLLHPDLESQFREVLQGGDFPHLKCITFEDESEFVDSNTFLDVAGRNRSIEAMCYEARVEFRVRKICLLSKGGKHHPWFLEAVKIRQQREIDVGEMLDG